MAWQIPISTSSAGVVANLGTTDDLYVGAQVMLASTGSSTVRGTGSDHEVLVYGTVATGSSLVGVWLGDNSTADSGNKITIEVGGRVDAPYTAGYGVAFESFNSDLINKGAITGGGYGAFFAGSSASTDSSLTNTGTIQSGYYGVFKDGTETLKINNSGLISGGAYSLYSSGLSGDVIANTGRIVGDIYLGAGNDTYSGASGRFSGGEIYGGDGNDTITTGIDNDTIYGGNDNDTLSGNGGNDRLFGEAGNDSLTGGLGNDTLSAGAGNDVIYGGAGIDSLYGGIGNDKFIFNTAPSTSTNRDKVVDYSNIAGNNDTFNLENAVFTKLAAGALNAANFKLGAAAADANDYVIYNKATGILSYDADGNGAGATVQIAILTNKAALTVADFFVI